MFFLQQNPFKMKLLYLFLVFMLCNTMPQRLSANSVSIESIEYSSALNPRVPKKVKKKAPIKKNRIVPKSSNEYLGEISWISIAVIFLMGLFVLIFSNLLIMSIIGAIVIGIALLILLLDFLAFEWEISKGLISFVFGVFDGILGLLMLILGLIALHHIIWITGLILMIVIAITIIIAESY